MTLPDSVSQAAKWALVVGLAFSAADATAAVLQNRLQAAAKPLPAAAVVPVQADMPAQAVPPGLVSLLSTTEPEGKANETTDGGPTVAGDPSVKPAVRPAPTNMVLKGTMAGEAGRGLALIYMNGQTMAVGVGDEIAGLTLKSVSSYSVRLEGNGQIMMLEMDSNETLSPNIPAVSVAAAQPVDPIQPEPQPSETPEEMNADSGAILTQRELRNILDNPASFAGNGFRMKPVLNNGDIVGMRVAITNQSHPLARLGIQNGDGVKSLNGTPLNGPEALSNIYRLLRNTSNLSFEVDRNGTAEKIDITLEE